MLILKQTFRNRSLQSNSTATDKATLLGNLQMISNKVRIQYHVTIYLDDIIARSLSYRLIQNDSTAESLIFLPYMYNRTGEDFA